MARYVIYTVKKTGIFLFFERIGCFSFIIQADMMHTNTNTHDFFLYFIALFTLVAGCNITGTEYYSPAFTVIHDSIESRIKPVTDFKQIEFRAVRTKNAEGEIIKNGVEIDIVHTDRLPVDNSRLNELARQIALTVRQCLKNPDDFGYYQVIFSVQQGINRLVKKETINQFILKTAELQEPVH